MTERFPWATDLLVGQTAVVTGSSSGIGQAIAVTLARAGAKVHLHARANEAGLAATRKQIPHGVPSGCDFLIDLASQEGCQQLVEQAWDKGPIDIWVNNAGADLLTGERAAWSFPEKLAALWAIDVRGTIELSRAVGAKMQQRGTGVLINMGWDQAEIGMAGESGQLFAAAKGSIMAFSRSLAKSLAPAVRVNCLAPGWIHTQWAASASDYWQRRAQHEALLQRWGTPEDVAQAACFLASPAAGFMTGQVLPVNGGFAGSYGLES